MKIYKFGGSSIKSADRFQSVISIIAHERPCAVVVSALGGVTDTLLHLTERAAQGESYQMELQELFERHDSTISLLKINHDLIYTSSVLQTIKTDLIKNLQEIAFQKVVSPQLKDSVLSAGELWSANIMTAACNTFELDVEFLDARKCILTDDHFGHAFVHYQKSYDRIRTIWKKITKTQIIPGFIGATEQGVTTTIGRNGSDYSASIFGAALNVEEIVIWTDVNGILTADPHMVSEAKTIPHTTYEEAMELAHAGAKVIHPPTMIPALYKSIPIRIKNTFSPENPGTLITKTRTADGRFAVGISSLYNVALIRFQGAGIIGRYGVIGRIFQKLAEQKINIILVSQVFSEHSICFAIKPDEVINAIAVLNNEFAFELENRFIDAIRIEENLSLIAVVGEGMRHTPGIAGKLFHILGKNKINIIAIAQGSSERNISFIVNSHDSKPALQVLHDHLFADHAKLPVFIVGTGLVGSALIRLIDRDQKLKISGIANSKKMVLGDGEIHFNTFQEKLSKGENTDLSRLIQWAKKTPHAIFVDATASALLAQKTAEILASGIHVVAANKIANSMTMDYYRSIRENCKKTSRRFLYEANVGAGLPIIETLKTLQDTGDKILKIEGIMSGTISYLFSSFDGTIPFSSLVESAREKGYTEPDPREDLCGRDVARKILILARETGASLEMMDIAVESLVPAEMNPDLSVINFLKEFSKFDHIFLKKFRAAKKSKKVLRYIASWDGQKAKVELQSVGKENPFYYQNGRENFFIFTTERYFDVPMIIRGHGAGAEVTAAAVLGDILKCIH